MEASGNRSIWVCDGRYCGRSFGSLRALHSHIRQSQQCMVASAVEYEMGLPMGNVVGRRPNLIAGQGMSIFC